MRYRGDLTTGALKVRESRIIAGLLLEGYDKESWDQALYEDNVLQTRTPRTAKLLGHTIRHRLELMKPELWELVSDGSKTVATHACLAATIKRSYLLGDFLDIVMREQYKLYAQSLSRTLWERYLEDCRARDSDMPEWSNSTKERLRHSVFLVLVEAGYMNNSRDLRLQPNYIARPVISYLENNNEEYVLRCLQVGS